MFVLKANNHSISMHTVKTQCHKPLSDVFDYFVVAIQDFGAQVVHVFACTVVESKRLRRDRTVHPENLEFHHSKKTLDLWGKFGEEVVLVI